ncbi:oxidoreductase [Brachybacterium phenoliresistens]|uniref:Oxidoreductase n=1 Tax=Brachybacterium phenoliresistens TaxID=396014 RepID=Z9JU73_9MICO|nr:molybdopterin-dependent oxidoreductase [Brachybacterium phenoliresistens]EWS81538.1 oxidoreductase [Brachybacterium phenoliresistens]
MSSDGEGPRSSPSGPTPGRPPSGPAARRAPSGARLRRLPWGSALVGLVAGAALLAVAELASLPLSAASAPLVAIGGAFIDVIPPWVKDAAIALFGTYDKAALFASMLAVYGAVMALLGILGAHRPRAAMLGVGGLGLAAAGIVLTRAGTGPADALPVLLGTAAGIVVLRVLGRMMRPAPAAPGAGPEAAGVRRRPLLVTAGAGLVFGALGVGARALHASRDAAGRAARAFALPSPRSSAPAIPEQAQSQVAGMPPFLTPTAEFYRIDTALAVPRVDPQTWRLRVGGLVRREVVLDLAQLLALPMLERHITLTCVSNPVGGDLAGNATWLGVPVSTILEMAGVREGADMVLSRSVDGFTASTPLEALRDGRDALIAVGMNGAPLPPEHGFPVRMVVPGLYGYVSATKWLTELTVTRFADDRAYWTDRGWSERGPIKIASRIDVPRAFAVLERDAQGAVMLGGTAWAQQRGISAVQVRIDEGPWRDAELAASVSEDCWTQWSLRWDGADAGRHAVTVRAVDGDGQEQTAERADPVPDGASGWHEIRFEVA